MRSLTGFLHLLKNSYKVGEPSMNVPFCRSVWTLCAFFQAHGFINSYTTYYKVLHRVGHRKYYRDLKINVYLTASMQKAEMISGISSNQGLCRDFYHHRSVTRFQKNVSAHPFLLRPFSQLIVMSSPSRIKRISIYDLRKMRKAGVFFVLSTNLGFLSDLEAHKHNVGGILLCKIIL